MKFNANNSGSDTKQTADRNKNVNDATFDHLFVSICLNLIHFHQGYFQIYLYLSKLKCNVRYLLN